MSHVQLNFGFRANDIIIWLEMTYFSLDNLYSHILLSDIICAIL